MTDSGSWNSRLSSLWRMIPPNGARRWHAGFLVGWEEEIYEDEEKILTVNAEEKGARWWSFVLRSPIYDVVVNNGTQDIQGWSSGDGRWVLLGSWEFVPFQTRAGYDGGENDNVCLSGFLAKLPWNDDLLNIFGSTFSNLNLLVTNKWFWEEGGKGYSTDRTESPTEAL